MGCCGVVCLRPFVSIISSLHILLAGLAHSFSVGEVEDLTNDAGSRFFLCSYAHGTGVAQLSDERELRLKSISEVDPSIHARYIILRHGTHT